MPGNRMSEPPSSAPKRRPSIVTRGGDDGETSLLYGQRAPKNHPQLACCGAFDELSSALGLARAASPDAVSAARLLAIQRDLIPLMGEVVVHESDRARWTASPAPRLGEAELGRIEADIAAIEPGVPPLRDWAIPGATAEAAALDFARAVARRAERALCELPGHGVTVRPVVRRYVNRLSDLLWLLARTAERT